MFGVSPNCGTESRDGRRQSEICQPQIQWVLWINNTDGMESNYRLDPTLDKHCLSFYFLESTLLLCTTSPTRQVTLRQKQDKTAQMYPGDTVCHSWVNPASCLQGHPQCHECSGARHSYLGIQVLSRSSSQYVFSETNLCISTKSAGVEHAAGNGVQMLKRVSLRRRYLMLFRNNFIHGTPALGSIGDFMDGSWAGDNLHWRSVVSSMGVGRLLN